MCDDKAGFGTWKFAVCDLPECNNIICKKLCFPIHIVRLLVEREKHHIWYFSKCRDLFPGGRGCENPTDSSDDKCGLSILAEAIWMGGFFYSGSRCEWVAFGTNPVLGKKEGILR